MHKKPMQVRIASLPKEAHDALVRDLREVFADIDASPVLLFSAEPPAWVDFIANVATWGNLLKLAVATYLASYFKQLGKMHAEATPAQLKRARSAAERVAGATIAPIRTLFAALRRAQQAISRNVGVYFRIPGPGIQFTVISLSIESEEEFIAQVALFIGALEGICRAGESIVQREGPPFFEVYCRLRPRGFRCRWQGGNDREFYQQEFDSDGNPTTEPTQVPRKDPSTQ